MIKQCYLLLLSAFAPSLALADTTFYGRINIAAQSATTAAEHRNKMISNASRLGVKGKIGNSLKLRYQVEYAVDLFDADKQSPIFTQRDIYLGIEGILGTLLAGKLSTPLKSAKHRIDLFSDLEGDIKSLITDNDNRKNNTLLYRSPLIANRLTFQTAYIAPESGADKQAFSMALGYQAKRHYLSFAFDQNVEKPDVRVLRIVNQYNFEQLQIGALFEYQHDRHGELANGYAWLLSAKYTLDKLAVKGHFGRSETHHSLNTQASEIGRTYSLGMDYSLSEQSKVFNYYTVENSDDNSFDNRYFGIGIEHRF